MVHRHQYFYIYIFVINFIDHFSFLIFLLSVHVSPSVFTHSVLFLFTLFDFAADDLNSLNQELISDK